MPTQTSVISPLGQRDEVDVLRGGARGGHVLHELAQQVGLVREQRPERAAEAERAARHARAALRRQRGEGFVERHRGEQGVHLLELPRPVGVARAEPLDEARGEAHRRLLRDRAGVVGAGGVGGEGARERFDAVPLWQKGVELGKEWAVVGEASRDVAHHLDGAGAALLERLHRLHEALECGRVSTQGLGNLEGVPLRRDIRHLHPRRRRGPSRRRAARLAAWSRRTPSGTAACGEERALAGGGRRRRVGRGARRVEHRSSPPYHLRVEHRSLAGAAGGGCGEAGAGGAVRGGAAPPGEEDGRSCALPRDAL
mmetsp:Transcript_4115/g.13792  ORF Transcript_4115/g.13792 Transcript_4115/m.13792 type:complete len:312 (-) Transcript_4115:419-1354(-)